MQLWKRFNELTITKKLRLAKNATIEFLNSLTMTVTSAALVITQAAHNGMIIVLSKVNGQTITLPAATGSGSIYRFIIGLTITSVGTVIQVANATDEFAGIVYQVDSDTADALVAYPAVDADGFDTITLDGSTTGGLAGDEFEIVDVAPGLFKVIGHTRGTGAVATPLSAAV